MHREEDMEDLNQFRFGTDWRDQRFDGEAAFAAMRTDFERAVKRFPDEVHQSFYTFAGRSVRIRVVGRQLAEHIVRPFAHLRASEPPRQSPQLSIDLWDDNKTERRPPPGPEYDDLPWTETTVQSTGDRFLGQRLPHTFSCLDRQASRIMAAIAWHDRIFIYERAKPLARLLLTWHNDRQVQIIHTGLIARNGSGILLVGKSGSGKSTSSLACIAAGFDYLSEDYVGLEECADGSFLGHSLYNSVFVKTTHLARFEELLPYAYNGRLPHEEKSVIVLSQLYPERLKRTVPIRALAFPQVVDAERSDFRPASKGEALLALGPSSLLQIPNRRLGGQVFARLGELVARVPCYCLRLGRDLRSIPTCVDALLSQLGSA
jgi:hypothetical protein